MSKDLIQLIVWPEAQGASRVAHAVAQLEQQITALRAQTGAAAKSPNTQEELTTLRQENQRLAQRQGRALSKLESLIQSINALPNAPEEKEENAGKDPAPEKAA